MTEENPLSILIIEDSSIMQQIATVFLSGHEILEAKTGKDGLEIFEQSNPDIVFLDIGLPDINGHEVLQKMRATNPDTFVIIVTGSRENADIQESILEGAHGYLIKPFSKIQMQECIDLYYENLSVVD